MALQVYSVLSKNVVLSVFGTVCPVLSLGFRLKYVVAHLAHNLRYIK